jgi:hypothetical protein
MSDLMFLPSESRERWGMLCVRDSFYCYDQPQKITQYWPLHSGERYRNDVLATFPELETSAVAVQAAGSGSYRFTRSSGERCELMLPEGGSTKAIRVETSDVPAPKVRKGTEIRWRNGCWEKYLKSAGWTLA